MMPTKGVRIGKLVYQHARDRCVSMQESGGAASSSLVCREGKAVVLHRRRDLVVIVGKAILNCKFALIDIHH
jgi:hypothetical protein